MPSLQTLYLSLPLEGLESSRWVEESKSDRQKGTDKLEDLKAGYSESNPGYLFRVR